MLPLGPAPLMYHTTENAARAVRGQVPTPPGTHPPTYLPPWVPSPLGTYTPRYLPYGVGYLGGYVSVGWAGGVGRARCGAAFS